MPERFTETMRAAREAGWSHAVQHRFVNELFAGAVPDAVVARYLIQDHRFLDSFLVLREAADTRSYAAALSVLVVAEWLYLDWASRAPEPLPDNFVHASGSRCTTI